MTRYEAPKMRCTICARLGVEDVWIPADQIVDHIELHARDRDVDNLMRWPDGKIVVLDCDITPESIISNGKEWGVRE